MQQIFRFLTALFQDLFDGSMYRVDISRIQRIRLHDDISGISRAQRILCADVQAHGRGDHYQHHGGKNTD